MWEQLKNPNLDPYIYSNGKLLLDWLGYCLAYVRAAFGSNSANTAREGWDKCKYRHMDRNFPKGVYFPVWFDHYGTYNGTYKNWGHVAIYKDGKIWSSPLTRKPYADVFGSIQEVETKFKATFIGWSEDVCGTRVIEFKGEPMPYTDAQYNAVVKERDAEKAKVTDLTKQVQTLTKQIADNEKSYTKTVGDLNKSLTDLQAEFQKVKLTVEAHERMIGDQEKVIGIKNDEISRLVKDNDSLRAQLGEPVTVGVALKVVWEAITNKLRKD